MRRSILPSVCLAAAALTCLAGAARAAEFDKYLPDDAQMVAVVNVKQVTSWVPFQTQIKDQIEQLLKADAMQQMLKGTDIDPLRDVDRVIVVSAASSPQIVKWAPSAVPTPIKPPPGGNPPPGGAALPPGVAPPPAAGSTQSVSSVGPMGFPTFFLIQGKFDADKIEAKAQQALKDYPDMVKRPRMVGGVELWESSPPSTSNQPHTYFALLDKNTLMVTLHESQALEALDKAAGKRTTDLKDKQVRAALAKPDSKAAVQAVASGELVNSVAMKSDGKGGVTTTMHSLHDDGIEGLRGAVTLGDADLHSEWTLTVKDADKAKDMAKSMNDVLGKAIKDATTAAFQMKELLPVVDALKTVKIAASGDTISVEGSAPPDAVVGGVKAWFTIRQPDVPPPPPPDVRPSDKPKPDAPPPPKKDK